MLDGKNLIARSAIVPTPPPAANPQNRPCAHSARIRGSVFGPIGPFPGRESICSAVKRGFPVFAAYASRQPFAILGINFIWYFLVLPLHLQCFCTFLRGQNRAGLQCAGNSARYAKSTHIHCKENHVDFPVL